ncbi:MULTISPECIES: phosphoenolpyruvate--protein phosphotransferase [Corallincola]|uniref:phosphoenolpyruvate--protein phosphotransferase n=3 Tax=Corallincola TaxID=1775176 RepID=A0A368N899_9GAMM|nr:MULTISPECIES: phosphoenolpyruvate--protein phosphotransferase [Corallincola]RCU45774.1 phosphoenolpyruvate-protein phosphotransferase PtsP [Corallincola holothuriorum]TAA41892.1 phosphoenolpyruvate--protein phosphotransferase [Corallincola spongiicola]TCI02282.1 phosphoenolpyruvate--protein phosphotransferase [Corallincola luteus]
MLTTLRRIVQQVNQTSDLEHALDLLAAETKAAMSVDCCSVYLADYEQQQFLLMATDGLEQAAVGQVTIGFSEGLVGLVGQREEPINVANAQQHPRFKFFPEAKEDTLCAFLGTPIIHHRKVLGVLVVQHADARQFSANEESFLVTLAAQLATVIAHAEARGVLERASGRQRRWVKTLKGVPGSPGVVIGRAFVAEPSYRLESVPIVQAEDKDAELKRFIHALASTRQELRVLANRMTELVSPEVAAIFEMYQQMLQDASIADAVEAEIEQGLAAQSAVKKVLLGFVDQFEAMTDPYIRERASDVRDLGQRLLAQLNPNKRDQRQLEDEVILVAEEVTASMLAEIPRRKLAGLLSMRGSNNSHAAILARAMGVPALLGIEEVPVAQLDGLELIIDGYSGELYVSPNEAVLSEYRRLIGEEDELRSVYTKQADLSATTPDGFEVRIHLNAGLSADTDIAHSSGADGVGLYRTEIPFMMEDRFPSEEAQFNIYRKVLQSYCGRPVTMRTLDVGGDKSLPYFPINEDNPFLGWRGIRMTLDHPEIFLVQIRAMLRANLGMDSLNIMFPMITSISEVDEALRLTRQAYREVSEEIAAQGNDQLLARPKIGVMIEVPGIIYQLPALASRVDFISVGSNDLTQYLLAVDRNNSRVAELYDSYHPAVLLALKHIFDQAHKCGIPVSLCGELAGEPAGALLLMAMGYRQLSMNIHNIPKIKWVIRKARLDQSKQVLDQVLALESPNDVRRVMSQHLETLGLGGLVRAGK